MSTLGQRIGASVFAACVVLLPVATAAALLTLFDCRDLLHLQTEHAHQVKFELASDRNKRDACFSESLAAGNREFVEEARRKLDAKARTRGVVEQEDTVKALDNRSNDCPVTAKRNIELSNAVTVRA